MAHKCYVAVRIDVLNADVSLLTGLHDLKKEKLLINYLDNKLADTKRRYFIPITYKQQHTFIMWMAHKIYFTKQESRHVHVHSLHPLSD